MDKLPDLQELINGVKERCGTGILFWLATFWFISGFANITTMPFMWLWRLAGYDPIPIFMLSGGVWFVYGLILSVIATQVNFRKWP
jgi:hypothetical protein